MGLTPELQRQVLNLDLNDRVALLHALQRSMPHPDAMMAEAYLARWAQQMRDISGWDVKAHGKERSLVNARTVFCFVARTYGISQRAIAGFLRQDRTTVSCTESRMRTALSMPKAYPEMINLYNVYTELITK